MSAQIRWCVLCNHFYEFSVNNEDFCDVTKLAISYLKYLSGEMIAR